MKTTSWIGARTKLGLIKNRRCCNFLFFLNLFFTLLFFWEENKKWRICDAETRDDVHPSGFGLIASLILDFSSPGSFSGVSFITWTMARRSLLCGWKMYRDQGSGFLILMPGLNQQQINESPVVIYRSCWSSFSLRAMHRVIPILRSFIFSEIEVTSGDLRG